MHFYSNTRLTWFSTARLITNPLWRRNDGSTTPLAEPWRTRYDQYHCEETHTELDERTACDPTWARFCYSGWKGFALMYRNWRWKVRAFSIPTLVLLEYKKHPDAYVAGLPTRRRPTGGVVTPTKGLADNIVRLFAIFCRSAHEFRPTRCMSFRNSTSLHSRTPKKLVSG